MRARRQDDDWLFGPKLRIPARAFPKDLAGIVCTRWDRICSGDYVTPPCPPRKMLQTLLETAYLTASAPEEGRFPQFNIVAVPAGDFGNQEIGRKWPFNEPRPLSVSETRRLAPAVDVRKSAIWVEWNETGWEIAGLVDLGTSWFRARMGLGYNFSSTSCLLIEIDRPGRMKVYQGPFHVATLTDGEVERFKGIEMPTAALAGPSGGGLRALRADIVPPKLEEPREFREFEFIALWNTYAAIANSISLGGHGGALVITPGGTSISDKNLKIKYRQRTTILRSAFVGFINARHYYGDLITKHENGTIVSDEEQSHAELKWRDAHADLIEATRFTAQLAGCDGAIVITNDLVVLGFGAEIRAELREDVEVVEVINELQRSYRFIDIEQFGMRHRSACKLASQDPNLSVLVISQDGPVSAEWSDNNRVVIRRRLNMVNMNMIWA